MRGQDLGDQRLEFFHHGVADFAAFFLGERLLQRAALVHGGGGDDAPLVRHPLQSGEFPGRKLHKSSDKCVGMVAGRTERGRLIIVIRA